MLNYITEVTQVKRYLNILMQNKLNLCNRQKANIFPPLLVFKDCAV